MAALPTADGYALRIDLMSALRQSRTRGNISRARTRTNIWQVWCQFCHSLNLTEFLPDVDDAIPILLAFMVRYRDGRLALQHHPVLARTVEDVARQIGETFEALGAPNIRLTPSGRIDTRLSGIVAHWKQQDPPPKRQRPVPLSIIIAAASMAFAVKNVVYDCLGDMLIIGFFFVCRPGEFTAGTDSCRPFRFQDVAPYVGPRRLDPLTASLAELNAATFVSLTFTNQKNAVPGETIGLGRTGHPIACAIKALARRLHYLQATGATPDMPLCSHKIGSRWFVITASQVTNLLRSAIYLHGAPFGLKPHEASARSLRSSGAMAMMCGGVDTSRSRLQGRWLTDVMFRYLSVQHAPLCADIARRMVAGGEFDTVPTAVSPTTPTAAAILPQAPNATAMAVTVASYNPRDP